MAKVAWVGLGHMGVPMAINLVHAGHDVRVYNRTASKCDPVVTEGAKVVSTAAEAAKDTDYIFTSLADSKAMTDVYLGTDGICSVLKSGQICIDMSTVSVASSAECDETIEAMGATFLRTPVSGSTVLANSGSLTLLCSGPQTSYDKTMPLFEKLGKIFFYLGEGDQARTMKLALNMMIGTSLQMLAESLVLCQKADIDWKVALDVIDGSVLGSPLIKYKSPPLRDKNYAPAFSTRLMAKDLDLAMEVAQQFGVCVPSTSLTKQMLEALIANGKGEQDFSALVPLIQQLSGVTE